jgi:sulfate permease, SulP family
MMNSFYRVGGGTRIAGFLLAVATVILLLIGTGPIAYLRAFLHQYDRN